MGTGVGEAMLISAVAGAGTSAVTGGDPLKGALIGAATGGIGAGVAGTGAAAGAGSGATTGITAGATDAATQAALAQSASAPLTTAGATASPFTGMGASQAGFGTSAVNPVTGMPASTAVNPFSVSYVDPLAGSQIGAETAGQMAGQASAGTPTFPKLNQFYANNPILYPAGLGAFGAAMIPPERLDEKEKYSGSLSRFSYDPDRYRPAYASGGLADTAVAKRYMKGGHLGSYSDGGRLLKGPGDGMSDSIPATIGKKQPARLADSEFVVPADVVSHLGNGSTDAGAKRLYEMMDRVRKARTGKTSQGKEINANKYMPA
jgi:hypothetical protein